jgi:4'-phosphopantetheinyl transferase
MTSNITCADILNINWRDADACDFNMGNTINVWRIAISSNVLAVNDLSELLSADEQARANRYHQQKDRERFIISRGALRILLGLYLKMPPAEIVFETGTSKKPFVRPADLADLHYNTTHSGNYILIGVANTPVGIDIENLEQLFPYQDILEHSFSASEITLINQSVSPLETFYTLWTRKEALLKATAKGIDDDMKHVPCLDGEHTIQNSIIRSNENWFVSSFDVDTDYTGSIATLTKDIKFGTFRLIT